MESKTSYVCGFFFDSIIKQVALIWKQKPKWQAGKLNGIGGKIESGETPEQAMQREFKEETGVAVANWGDLIVLSGEDWEVYFFYAVDIEEIFEYVTTKETEEVAKIEINSLDQFDYIPNLQWLIPLAIYKYEHSMDKITFSQLEKENEEMRQEIDRLKGLIQTLTNKFK